MLAHRVTAKSNACSHYICNVIYLLWVLSLPTSSPVVNEAIHSLRTKPPIVHMECWFVYSLNLQPTHLPIPYPMCWKLAHTVQMQPCLTPHSPVSFSLKTNEKAVHYEQWTISAQILSDRKIILQRVQVRFQQTRILGSSVLQWFQGKLNILMTVHCG